MTADQRERSAEIDRGTDRPHGGRGGRRATDRGRPWWQKGLFLGRCWRSSAGASCLPTVADVLAGLRHHRGAPQSHPIRLWRPPADRSRRS